MTSRARGHGNQSQRQTNNSNTSDAPSTANTVQLTLAAANSNSLNTQGPPAWFSAEMKKFADTIQTSVTTRLHEVDAALEKMSEAITVTNNKVTALETKCTEYETTAVDLRQGLTELEQQHRKEVMELREKLDDYENRQRRNNLRIVGFPLGVEGGKAEEFLEKWIPELLELTSPIEIERAHRAQQRRRGEQGAPRAFVLKLLRYRDVTRILDAARKKGEINYGNSKIMIFPDLSPRLHQKRMAFVPLKKQLRQAGVKYGMLYPAILRVDTRSGGTKSFESAEAATSFLQREYPEVFPAR